MGEFNIDFEGTGNQGNGSQPDGNNGNGGGTGTSQEDVTNLNGGDKDDVTGKDGTKNNPDNKEDNDNSSTGGLTAGTELEFDGAKYTVAENGDIVVIIDFSKGTKNFVKC